MLPDWCGSSEVVEVVDSSISSCMGSVSADAESGGCHPKGIPESLFKNVEQSLSGDNFRPLPVTARHSQSMVLLMWMKVPCWRTSAQTGCGFVKYPANTVVVWSTTAGLKTRCGSTLGITTAYAVVSCTALGVSAMTATKKRKMVSGPKCCRVA